MNWREGERWVADLLGATLVTDRDRQLQDIDLEWDDHVGHHTASVKTQPALSRYRNLAFELELLDSEGKSIPGCWSTCAAEFYAVVSPQEPLKVGGRWSLRPAAFLWCTSALAAVVNDPEMRKKWDVKTLKPSTVAYNGGMGRTFVNSRCLIVPLEDVRMLCRWVRFKEEG